MLNIVTLPHDDLEFRTLVTDTATKLGDGLTDGHDPSGIMTELVQRLLPQYPEVDVRQQDGLASFDDNPRTWYVYRDGPHHLKPNVGEPG